MPVLPCGHDVSDAHQTHYCSYLRITELLALQPAAETLRHHDELLFIITHQATELWFKLVLHELDLAIALITRDQIGSATWLVRRIEQIFHLLAAQIMLPNTIAPQDFFAFRGALRPASGGESLQFKLIEQRSGRLASSETSGCPMHAPAHSVAPPTQLPSDAHAPMSLRTAFLELLARRNVTIIDLYTPLGNDGPSYDLFLCAEALIAYDQQFRTWRTQHVAMVERMLSRGLSGTGASTGVRYLEQTVATSYFFPELWQARATLWQQAGTVIGISNQTNR